MRPLIAVLLLLPALRADAGQAEEDRFLKEYPEAAKRLEAKFARVRGTARLEERARGRVDKVAFRTSVVFASDHGKRKVELHDEVAEAGKPLVDRVYCLAPDGGYSLVRIAPSKDYVLRAAGADRDGTARSYGGSIGQFIECGYLASNAPLSEVMKMPAFKLTSVEEFTSEGRALMRVKFYVGEFSKGTAFDLVLDPAAGWIMRSGDYRVEALQGIMGSVEVEYGPPVDGIPVPRRVRSRAASGKRTLCEFTKFEFAPTPEAEFSMAHYGLPDLSVPVTSSRAPARDRTTDWVIAGGSGGLLVAGAIARVVRRRA